MAKQSNALDRFGDPLPHGIRVRLGGNARLGTRRYRMEPKDWPKRIAIARDGSRLAVQVADLKLRVYDASTGAALHTLRCTPHRGAGKQIEDLAVSPDGSLVAASIKNHIHVFDSVTGELQHEIVGGNGDRIEFTHDGRSLVVTHPLRLFDLSSGNFDAKARGSRYGALELSDDGRLAIEYDGGIAIHDVRTLACKREVKVELNGDSLVQGFMFTGDRELLVIRYQAGESCYLDLETGAQRAFEWPLPGALYHLVGKSDGTVASAIRCHDGTYTREVIDLGTRVILQSLEWRDGHYDAAFGASRLAVMQRSAIRVFETPSLRELDVEDAGHTVAVHAVRFDGDTLVTYAKDSTRTWSLGSGRPLGCNPPSDPPAVVAAHGITARQIHENDRWSVRAMRGDAVLFDRPNPDRPTRVRVSPTEPVVAYVDWIGWLRVLDGETGNVRWSFQSPHGKVLQPLTALAFSADGSRIAAGGHGKFVAVFDTRTGDQRVEMKGHTANVDAVAFSPSGTLLFSRDTRTTRVWNVATGRELGTLKQLWPDAWSEDGRMVATIEGTSVVVWEPASVLPADAAAALISAPTPPLSRRRTRASDARGTRSRSTRRSARRARPRSA